MDIAHALSLQARWTGHTKRFLSVAQHSVGVSRHCDPKDALWGLLHDASEAYLSDLARPVKRDPRMAFYQEAESQLMQAVAERFDLVLPIPESVHIADNRMLMTERRDLLVPMEWSSNTIKMAGAVEPYEDKIESWSPLRAENEFLWRFQQLSGGARGR